MESNSDLSLLNKYNTPAVLHFPGMKGQIDIKSRNQAVVPVPGAGFGPTNPTVTVTTPTNDAFIDPKTFYIKLGVSFSGTTFSGVPIATTGGNSANLLTSSFLQPSGVVANVAQPYNTAIANAPLTHAFIGTNVYLSQAGASAFFNTAILSTIDGTKIEEIPINLGTVSASQNMTVNPDYTQVLANTEKFIIGKSYLSNSVVGNFMGYPINADGTTGGPGALTTYAANADGTSNIQPVNVGWQIPSLGQIYYFDVNLPFGLLNQVSAIPNKLLGGLKFDFTMAQPKNLFIFNPVVAGAMAELGIANMSYTVASMELRYDSIKVSDSYIQAMSAHIMGDPLAGIPGAGLQIPYTTFKINNTHLTGLSAGSQTPVYVSGAANSVQAVNMFHILTTDYNNQAYDGLVAFKNNGLGNFQFIIGSVQFPNKPINTLMTNGYQVDTADAYIEMLKTKGVYKSYIGGTLLDYNPLLNRHIYGYSLERTDEAMSGVTVAGKSWSTEVQYASASADCQFYTLLRVDSIININPDGSLRVLV